MLWDTLHWRFTTGGREQRERREQPPRPLSFLWWLHDQFFTSTGSSGLNLMQVAFVEFCIQNGQEMTRKCPIRLWILCFGLVDPFWGNVLILTKWRAHFQHLSTHWDHWDPGAWTSMQALYVQVVAIACALILMGRTLKRKNSPDPGCPFAHGCPWLPIKIWGNSKFLKIENWGKRLHYTLGTLDWMSLGHDWDEMWQMWLYTLSYLSFNRRFFQFGLDSTFWMPRSRRQIYFSAARQDVPLTILPLAEQTVGPVLCEAGTKTNRIESIESS